MGAGLAGLSTAYALEKLGLDYVIIEKELDVGGLCTTSYTKEGFAFDKTLHVLHLNSSLAKNLISEFSAECSLTPLIEHVRKAKVFFEGEYIPYPFQSYYSLLSNKQVVRECTEGIKKSLEKQKPKPQNLEEYIESYFGQGIAKYFMIPYNEKLWTLSVPDLSIDWADRFIPKPDYNGLLRTSQNTAILSQLLNKEWGYNPRFLYPEKGGIQAISNAILGCLKNGKIIMHRAVEKIDVTKRIAVFDNGETIDYDVVISTAPLPQLLNMIKESPMIKEIVDNLVWVSVFNCNFGIGSKTASDAHWMYFPQKDIVFYRVAVPSNLSPFMAPKGCSSLSAEVSYSKFRPLGDKSEVRKRIVHDLVKVGLIENENDIACEHEYDLRYAYVVYDKNYAMSKMTAHAYLEKHNIFSIGRFGSWEYSAMEDAIVEGYETARQLNNTCR